MENKLGRLLEESIKPSLVENITKLESDYEENLNIYKSKLVEEFEVIFKNINENFEDIEVGVLMVTPLRTRLYNNNYKIPIYVYDESWYLSKKSYKVGEIDGEYVYKHHTNMNSTLNGYKKYGLEIIAPEVEILVREQLNQFTNYLTEILRYSISEITELEEYKKLNKCERLEIRCGEYYEPGSLIGVETTDKDYEELREELKERFKNSTKGVYFKDLKGIELKNEVYMDFDLIYADFRDSKIENFIMANSNMSGINFSNSKLKNTRITMDILHNGKFENCEISESEFVFCFGTKGVGIHEKGSLNPGYYGTSFKNSTIENVEFVSCILIGADFSGVRFKNVTFSECQLHNSLFDKKSVELLNLSEEQKASIKLL